MEVQKAGDNSTQVQASVINVYNGISEERARAIYKEEFEKIEELTKEAKVTAIQRVCELENRIIPKLLQIDKGLDFFSNPDFQFLLIEAQKAAARSERSVDYDLLTEMLVHRVNNDTDREKRLGIKKAVEIVDSISDDALLGLTVVHSVSYFEPVTGDIYKGLDALDNLFGKIIHGELPKGGRWLDHLDILGAIRINTISKLKPLCEYYAKRLDGYVCTGIAKNSDDYRKAIQMLSEVNISENTLVDNVLNPDYVRIPIPTQKSIDSMKVVSELDSNIPLSKDEVNAFKNIYSLYDNNTNIIRKVNKTFAEEWDKRKSLRLLKKWWGEIPYSISITEVGQVLAHANAQRCDNTLPPLN